MSSKNIPVKHHFNPAFSLQPWAGSDGRLCEMRRINGRVSACRRHPNATGFEKNLYRTDGVPSDQEQHLEVKFMTPLDTAADLALKRIMLGDPTPWDSEQRSAWVRYIFSLMFRNPAAVRSIRDHMLELRDVGIKALEANYPEVRRPTDPATFEEYFARTNPAAAQIGATNMIADIIDNQRLGPTIVNMHWSRINLPGSNVTLLNSDRPVDQPLGLSDPLAYIALPIGPRTLFLASNDATLAGRIAHGDPSNVVKLMNKAVVSQAREFVWGVDDSQLRFVKNHIGTAPERVIITAKQRQEALDAARGVPSTRDARTAA
jgi:Protein of unknown function (DUF4238)